MEYKHTLLRDEQTQGTHTDHTNSGGGYLNLTRRRNGIFKALTVHRHVFVFSPEWTHSFI